MQTTIYTINNQEIILPLRDDADESVAAEIFKLREYRIAEPVISQTTLPIFDVGAHAGFFTVYARALNPLAPIIALEPEPKNINALEQTIKHNSVQNLTIIKGALAKESGKRELALSEDSHNHKLKTNINEKKIITVNAFDFAYFKQLTPQGIGLLKMDIEGGEYEIFPHLTAADFAHIQAIIMEYHDLKDHKHQEIEQVLREHGFGVQTFPSKFEKTMGFLWAVNKRFSHEVL
ncbi:MAG: FkbM family methyltransferase [Candidatus Magasanikbacteria bacterium]|nr:FkbM family methyltransferase [Candidatus Magasanikbacteria bacterium]